jgi:flagellar basal body rod protein FlgG
MIYGLYLSAAGIMTNSYRQDVIANNLANSETVGFKKDVALFRERMTAAQEQRAKAGNSAGLLEQLTGGTWAAPTVTDSSQGDLENSSNPLDVALQGNGYLAVQGSDDQKMQLTRDGRMMINRQGDLILANNEGQKVLGSDGRAIQLSPEKETRITDDGRILQDDVQVARLGLFAAPDAAKLKKEGGNMYSYPDPQSADMASVSVRSGFTERSNVDPATELAALMDAQRQLEANARMISYQDQMLAKAVNDVGKMS